MITICKRFDFDAAHRLDFLPPDHKCNRLHGHTYLVDVELTGEPDANGMLIDYADVASVWSKINDALDHRYLNDIPGLMHPTTERLAEWIAAKLNASDLSHLLSRIRVHESSTTWAEWNR